MMISPGNILKTTVLYILKWENFMVYELYFNNAVKKENVPSVLVLSLNAVSGRRHSVPDPGLCWVMQVSPPPVYAGCRGYGPLLEGVVSVFLFGGS